MKSGRWKRVLSAFGLIFLGVFLGWLFPLPSLHADEDVCIPPVHKIIRTGYLFNRFRSELLASNSTGQHYMNLGHTYWNELVRLIWYDETMYRLTWRVIDLYSPAIEALLDGEEEKVRVSQEMVDEMLRFLTEMESRATPELREIIRRERAKVPWEKMVGLSVADAWEALQMNVPGEVSP
ncbi:MAG: hypothetical protein RML46_03885 [Anaerolineae bacterium]|nr:hypothetical protein [Anaerolineae bacterium]MDW8068032.1 hypothetical protein [Anaerolineae bacterium]